MSPRPQIEHIRRPQILNAAIEVIAERGIAATRISDVAERAGTSAPGVLYWFNSKDELLAEALTADEDRFASELALRLAAVPDPAGKLLAVIDACVEDNNWTLWIEFWTRALRDDQLRQARQSLDDRWRALLVRILRAGSESGVFAPVNADEAALTLAGLIDGLAVQVTLGDATLTRGCMRQICVDAAERLLDTKLDLQAASGSLVGAEVSR